MEGVSLIATFVYQYPLDDPLMPEMNSMWQEFERLGANLTFVQLTCEPDELLKRIEEPHRADMQKLASAEMLRGRDGAMGLLPGATGQSKSDHR